MDGQPAIAAVPDRSADDVAAAHRVADQVKVQGVAAQHAFLAEMAELGVADRAGGIAMIHRVAAHAGGIGRLDDDVAAQVGDLAAIVAVAEMRELQRLVERELRAVDGLDDALLGERPRSLPPSS